jgi:methyl-accepting chemotaxis protein
MEGANQQILHEIQQILVSLQFQDRVSQILGHVLKDMQKLETTLAQALGAREDARPPPPDSAGWLAELKSTYTTSEQHSLHHGTEQHNTSSSDDVTFF